MKASMKAVLRIRMKWRDTYVLILLSNNKSSPALGSKRESERILIVEAEGHPVNSSLV